MKNLFLIPFIVVCFRAEAQCEAFEMGLDVSHPTCYNFQDGNIDVTTAGGTLPVNGTITNVLGMIVDFEKKTFGMMGEGWYYVYVVDGNGCELYDSVYLINPPQMQALITVTDPTFTGACDGIAQVDTVLNAQGDYAAIGYFWSPDGPYGIGQTIKTGLCDANYNLVINDALGCSITEYMAVGSVGIIEESENAKIRLFPNPANAFLTLQTERPIIRIIVNDFSGKAILEISGEGATEWVIPVNELPNGRYQLAIVFKDSVEFRTFIKQQ